MWHMACGMWHLGFHVRRGAVDAAAGEGGARLGRVKLGGAKVGNLGDPMLGEEDVALPEVDGNR